jgi:hypothetical protein
LPSKIPAAILCGRMAQSIFHPSIEGAQHGAKSLPDFLDYARLAGASGAQPSNYMLHGGKLFKSAKEIQDAFAQRGMTLDGISAHCPFWVHTSAWTGTRSGNPFIPADVAKKSPQEIEKWAETYLLKLMDLAAELKIKIMPMFWAWPSAGSSRPATRGASGRAATTI